MISVIFSIHMENYGNFRAEIYLYPSPRDQMYSIVRHRKDNGDRPSYLDDLGTNIRFLKANI